MCGQTHLFLDFLRSIMPSVQQSLPSLISRFETVLMSINLALIKHYGHNQSFNAKHPWWNNIVRAITIAILN